MSAAAPFCRRSFFPEGHFPQVPPARVQQEFRRLFAVWGRPATVRVDNGAPWGSWSDLPPRLALWLIGLGIDMHWNTPCRPQENGVIERSQGLAARWAEPGQCRSVQELQRRLDHEDAVQREVYPALEGVSRMAADPQLRHSGRPYSRGWERIHWDWPRVLAHLSQYVVTRQVDGSGKIGHSGAKLYVGTLHKGKRVSVRFDPDRIEWLISDEHGHHLRSLPADLTPAALRRLETAPRW